MSAYSVKTTDSAVQLGSDVSGDDWNFRSDTIAGIQFSYQMNEKTDAVLQLVATGNHNYEVEASWAFLRYAITPNTKVRAGRMAAPLYLYTETIDVGFTYPWVRPPAEIYGVEANRYQGFDVNHDFSLLGWNAGLQWYVGDLDGGGDMSLKYSSGLGLTVSRGPVTLRGMVTIVEDLKVEQLPDSTVDSLTYYTLAARYDDGTWLGIIEGRHYSVDDKLSDFLPSNEAFYATLGYQAGRWMPYVTLAKEYTVEDGTAFAKTHQESVGLGLRYTLTDKVVLKGEATRYSAFNGTAGSMGLVTLPTTDPRDAAYADTLNILNRLDDDGATVMSIGFDAVF